MVNIVLIVPWVFLWAKRFRGAGQSALMAFIPIGAYIALASVLWLIGIWDVFLETMQAGTPHQGDMTAMQEAVDAVMLANVRKVEIAALVMPIFASLVILFSANKLIKVKRV